MDKKQSIISKINRSRKGSVFLPDSFFPIDVQYVSNVLSQLVKEGTLIRLAQGIYYKPKMTRFGPVTPSLFNIAEVIAKRDHAKILPSGPAAENYLGLSDQVPMNAVYLTNGSPRKLQIGSRTLTFKHGAPSMFSYKGKIMPILVLALKSIGKNNVTEETLASVHGILHKHPEDATWMDDIKIAPSWIRKIITTIKQQIQQNEQMD